MVQTSIVVEKWWATHLLTGSSLHLVLLTKGLKALSNIEGVEITMYARVSSGYSRW